MLVGVLVGVRVGMLWRNEPTYERAGKGVTPNGMPWDV